MSTDKTLPRIALRAHAPRREPPIPKKELTTMLISGSKPLLLTTSTFLRSKSNGSLEEKINKPSSILPAKPGTVFVQYDETTAANKLRPRNRKFLNHYVQVEHSKRKKVASGFYNVKPDRRQLKTFLHRCRMAQPGHLEPSPEDDLETMQITSRYRFSDILVCPVCKEVIAETPDPREHNSHVQSLLDTSDFDPFDSGAVSLDRTMNGTLHYCKLLLL